MRLTASKARCSQVYAWGNGLQGQLGVFDYQDLQPRPVVLPALANLKITQVACGANHTVALTLDGKVYFWGQYSLPVKGNEPAKYGRILSPKLHSSL